MNYRTMILTMLIFCSAILHNVSVQAQAHWPDFRGPSHNGHVPVSNQKLPTKLTKDQIKWTVDIHGRAWSSPVIYGDQVWLTTATEDGTKLYGVCVDRKTGKIVYDKLLFTVKDPQFAHRFNTYGSPSPVIEKDRVYITFGSPGTACIDTDSFETLWTRTDFVCDHFRGAGSSPVLYEDRLLMNFDGADHQFVVALSKKTGDTIWRTERSVDFKDIDPKTGKPKLDGDYRKGFSTPTVAKLGDGKTVMISLGSKACYAYNVEDGKELWRSEEPKNHSGSSRPIFANGTVYTPTGLPRGELWAIRPGGSGVVNDTHVQWTLKRGVPSKPSILEVDKHIYMVDDGGIVSCVNAESGEVLWKDRIKGKYSASPVYANGHVYFFSEEGNITVLNIKDPSKFNVVSTSKIGDGFMASPAVAENAFYIRSRTKLYRIDP